MTKEEILELSREDYLHNMGDPLQEEISRRNTLISLILFIPISTIMFFVDLFVLQRYNFGVFVAMSLVASIHATVQAITYKKAIFIISALIDAVMFVAFLLIYVLYAVALRAS